MVARNRTIQRLANGLASSAQLRQKRILVPKMAIGELPMPPVVRGNTTSLDLLPESAGYLAKIMQGNQEQQCIAHRLRLVPQRAMRPKLQCHGRHIKHMPQGWMAAAMRI